MKLFLNLVEMTGIRFWKTPRVSALVVLTIMLLLIKINRFHLRVIWSAAKFYMDIDKKFDHKCIHFSHSLF